MGRVEFKDIKSAEIWIRDMVINSNKNYHGYITSRNELILVPGKSTSPLLYGYVKRIKNRKELKNIEDEIPIYTCDNYEWSAEKTISRSFEWVM